MNMSAEWVFSATLLIISVLAYRKSGNDQQFAGRNPLLWLSAAALVAFVIQAANLFL